ncbi:hypothetical protein CYMTET_44345 [Cymbomonas tetramitiformis]|uniref:Uncharacterized protein n=1 Tax=Cymbomonas tetramitiformis TaxID=36881 RepID=A0AAE0C1P5_9CHLO|nr:hypothetical protein CYMTET_44345 [Cymbomonas tetramitiformis]|eukprot:gene155-279_t
MKLCRLPRYAPVTERCVVCDNDHDDSHTTEDGDKTVCPSCGVVGAELIFGQEEQFDNLDYPVASSWNDIKISHHINADKKSKLAVQDNMMRAEDCTSYIVGDVLHLFGEAFDAVFSNAHKTHYVIYQNGKKNSDSYSMDQELGIQHFWKVLLFIDYTSQSAFRDSTNTRTLESIANEKFVQLVPLHDGRLRTSQRARDVLHMLARYKLCTLIGEMGGAYGGDNGSELDMVHIARLPLAMCARDDSPLQDLGLIHFVVEKCNNEWLSVQTMLLREHASVEPSPKIVKRRIGNVRENGAGNHSAEDDYARDARVHFRRLEIGKKVWIEVLTNHMRTRNPATFKELSTIVLAAYGDQLSRKKWTKVANHFGGLFQVLDRHL